MRIRSVPLLSLALGFVAFVPSAQAQDGGATGGAAAVLVAPPQSATSTPSNDATALPSEVAGPRREAAVAGVQLRAKAETPRPAPVQARRSRTSTAATLTIVGAAAFLGGLLIDDDAGTAIAVVGLAVGLVGLYQWLR